MRTIITIILALVAMAGQAQTPKDSCSIPKDSPIAVGTGTWGIAAVIPKYMSLRLPERNKIAAQKTISHQKV